MPTETTLALDVLDLFKASAQKYKGCKSLSNKQMLSSEMKAYGNVLKMLGYTQEQLSDIAKKA